MPKSLAIDLFCGLGGWSDGLLAEGYEVVGFDIERHEYGEHRYPAQLVLQDVLTLHGSQFKDAALIVASPPCQAYSYMAMPWSRAKKIEAEYQSGERDVKHLTALFDACFRIQREACAAAGHYIPMIVENVRGAQKWVGRSRWNYGSFHLWGDVPALMPMAKAFKTSGMNWSNQALRGQDFTRIAGMQAGLKSVQDGLGGYGGSFGRIGSPGQKVTNQNPVNNAVKLPGFRFDGSGKSFQTASVSHIGAKIGGDWFSDSQSTCRRHSSKSNARKAASAMIAKIPLPLSRYIASVFKPL